MRSILVVTLLLAALPIESVALQATSDSFTGGMPNGRMWQSLTSIAKLAYLAGLNDGVNSFRAKLDRETKLEPFRNAIESAENTLYTKATYAEIIDQMDLFYKDSANARIPLRYSYEYSLKRIKGAASTELDDFLSTLRAFASSAK
jgi:hypothetical protein